MGMTAAYYLSQLQKLLPRGPAWPTEDEAALTKLLHAFADELARVDARAEDLVEEADPRTTAELLSDWERAFGLPDPCASTPDTTSERLAALVAKVTNVSGQSPRFYIDLAASLGYTITITEFKPFVAGGEAGDELTNGDWIFAWQANAPETSITAFVAGDGTAGDPLRDWGNDLLECALTRLKPAHTNVLFAYGG